MEISNQPPALPLAVSLPRSLVCRFGISQEDSFRLFFIIWDELSALGLADAFPLLSASCFSVVIEPGRQYKIVTASTLDTQIFYAILYIQYWIWVRTNVVLSNEGGHSWFSHLSLLLCCLSFFVGGGRSLKASPRGISDVTACRLLPGATWPRCNGKQGKGSRFAALSCPAWMQLLLCSPESLHSQRGSSSPTSRLVCTISHTHTHTPAHILSCYKHRCISKGIFQRYRG